VQIPEPTKSVPLSYRRNSRVSHIFKVSTGLLTLHDWSLRSQIGPRLIMFD